MVAQLCTPLNGCFVKAPFSYNTVMLAKGLPTWHILTYQFYFILLQKCSRSVKLRGDPLYTALLKSFHSFTIGFRSGL